MWQRKRLPTSFSGNSCLESEDGNCLCVPSRLRSNLLLARFDWPCQELRLPRAKAAKQPLTKTSGERSQVSADVYEQGWGGDRDLGERSSQRRLLLK